MIASASFPFEGRRRRCARLSNTNCLHHCSGRPTCTPGGLDRFRPAPLVARFHSLGPTNNSNDSIRLRAPSSSGLKIGQKNSLPEPACYTPADFLICARPAASSRRLSSFELRAPVRRWRASPMFSARQLGLFASSKRDLQTIPLIMALNQHQRGHPAQRLSRRRDEEARRDCVDFAQKLPLARLLSAGAAQTFILFAWAQQNASPGALLRPTARIDYAQLERLAHTWAKRANERTLAAKLVTGDGCRPAGRLRLAWPDEIFCARALVGTIAPQPPRPAARPFRPPGQFAALFRRSAADGRQRERAADANESDGG